MQQINKTTLDNGIRIITKNMPYVRSIVMGVWVDVGSRDETTDHSGLSHFIEHMIFKGTQKRTAFEIAKEFDAIGGQTNAFTSMEHTCYHAKVMDSQMDTMVNILCDIFLNSVFDPMEMEKERPVILQEIGMTEDNPEEHIHVLSGKNFWGDHPLGQSILGTRENIMGFDADTLKRFFHRFYQPDQIVISVAGNMEHNRVVDLMGPYFESIHAGNGLPDRHKPKGIHEVNVHQRTLEQAHICLMTEGLAIDDPDRFAQSLLNTIVGGNMSSHLFQNIREQRGLAYSIYSFICSHADAGMFGVYTGVESKHIAETLRLILKDLRRMAGIPVSPTELRDAKEFTKGNLYMAAESPDNQMFRMAQNELRFNRHIPMAEIVDKVEKVAADDILRVGQRLFSANEFSLTVLGNSEAAALYKGIIHDND
ncbi:MAG: insulinase family protein [Desulfobacteraceae bacterium]|nr:insulinase family protein [Desulfobacteraceae bacterium]